VSGTLILLHLLKLHAFSAFLTISVVDSCKFVEVLLSSTNALVKPALRFSRGGETLLCALWCFAQP
jgi:hypothetical protein